MNHRDRPAPTRRRRGGDRAPRRAVLSAATGLLLAGCLDADPGRLTMPVADAPEEWRGERETDVRLLKLLASAGFTGRVEQTLERRLGRPIDRRLAELGRLLWFDPITGLNDDNACAGCHSPTHGFGDTQPIAIGIDNNGVVGPARRGPRNQRRSPMIINSAFYPTLMWNSRFRAGSGDPFDNRSGFDFPAPEGTSLAHLPHLLVAQAFIPPTERVEAAGFHVVGDSDDLRAMVANRLNEESEYRRLFSRAFPEIGRGGRIEYEHAARAIAEFQFTQVYANAPIDRYARGHRNALTRRQKEGALLFFGRAGCVTCHAVSGRSNEMFSDFQEHVAGIPQGVPAAANVLFDGPGADEDFGLEQVTGNLADRYAFRTSPLRNVALQPAFMHNGAFRRLDDAIRFHLDARGMTDGYTPARLPPDLRRVGPAGPVLARLDPLLGSPAPLATVEIDALIEFVRVGLLDPEARPEHLRRLIPRRLPSGRPPLRFQFF